MHRATRSPVELFVDVKTEIHVLKVPVSQPQR